VNADVKARMPRQIPYIIANEGCERFSFYGMRNILTPFLTTVLLMYIPEKAMRELAAKNVFHMFVAGVYFFPLLGGWLADKFFGKYNTILWFSLIYCAGHGCLALFDDERHGFYAGLFLIAIGSGGIKPLVASFMGDQFDSRSKHLAKVVFDAFYWIINFGSFFASLLMPIFLREYGPSVAFGIPGILMGVATFVFWLGRGRYVVLEPAPNPDLLRKVVLAALFCALLATQIVLRDYDRIITYGISAALLGVGALVFWLGRGRYVTSKTPPSDPNSFLNVVHTALFTDAPGQANTGRNVAFAGIVLAVASIALAWPFDIVTALCTMLLVLLTAGGIGTHLQLERARGRHPDAAVDGVRAVLRILIVFALVTPFWSLFDQKATTWVLQANDMTKPSWFSPAQMQALNPALVMIIIPFNNLVLWPWLRRQGREPTQLQKMTGGIALAGAAWIVVGTMQLVLDSGAKFSIVWQVMPYILLTSGEVLVSATGLEFAYSQAPLAMKGAIMSFWNLAVTIGQLWVLLANHSVKSPAVIDQIKETGISVTAFLMFFFAAFAFAAAVAFHRYARRYRMTDNYRTS
jgi:proton-dependent oligopeptide transporter, POT family